MSQGQDYSQPDPATVAQIAAAQATGENKAGALKGAQAASAAETGTIGGRG